MGSFGALPFDPRLATMTTSWTSDPEGEENGDVRLAVSLLVARDFGCGPKPTSSVALLSFDGEQM